MEYAYKKEGLLGKRYVYEPSSSGDYVVMSKDDYNELIHNKQVYKKWYESEKEAHEQFEKQCGQFGEALKQANNKVLQTEASARKEIEAAEARVRVAEEERDRQKNLNDNLLRISRERANAKRGLQPKREHCGYRFSSKIMQTKTICGHDKHTGAIYADVWSAVLETPYDGTIPIQQIEYHIFDDLMGKSGILTKLHVNFYVFTSDRSRLWKGTYTEAIEADKDNSFLFDYKFMINPKSGLWEIQIMTTKSIWALAEMMEPRKK